MLIKKIHLKTEVDIYQMRANIRNAGYEVESYEDLLILYYDYGQNEFPFWIFKILFFKDFNILMLIDEVCLNVKNNFINVSLKINRLAIILMMIIFTVLAGVILNELPEASSFIKILYAISFGCLGGVLIFFSLRRKIITDIKKAILDDRKKQS